MRRQLAFVTLAVAVLVVLAFLIPLAALLRNQAENRALSLAERDAQSIAATLAVIGATESGTDITTELAAATLEAFGDREDVTIIFPDGQFRGAPFIESSNILAARDGLALTAVTDGGAEVLVPVLVAVAPDAGSTVVVRRFVPDEELDKGVLLAWQLLAGLGVFLVVVAVAAADRLGRSMVRPVTALSEAARSLGSGDLETRVDPEGPDEIAEVGEAFNFLAGRLDGLLSAERESIADLSHRLRTPLTALRLQAETLHDRDDAASLLADVDRLERAVDRMIEEARMPGRDESGTESDIGSVVRHRATFWKVLADEQGRPSTVHTTGGPLIVKISSDELGAVVDTLIENVFAHTPPGTGYSISASPLGERAVLVVEDDGPGFDDTHVLERGASGGGSTGLGLDIALRAAQRSGGGLLVVDRPNGGARVEVTFGLGVAVR
ncbi:MAG: HAMP domain-containing protein [Acidimicrobiia bacterium]